MKDILLINNKARGTGIGTYGYSLCENLKKITPRNIDLLTLTASATAEGESALKKFPQSVKKLLDHSGFLFKIPRSYKIYHVLNPNLGIMLPTLHPSVVTVHDIAVLKGEVRKEIMAASHGLEIPLVLGMQINMNFIKEADRILCVSNYTKNDLTQILGIPSGKVTVTYPGIDHQQFKPRDKASARRSLGLPVDKPIILHVGTDEPRKNMKTLIEATQQVKKKIPHLMLVKVGGLRQETKRFLSEAHLLDSVVHVKKTLNIGPFYNAADVFVFPSYYEGFGFPALEAMASGCPVVAADSSSITEVVGDGGVLVQPFNVAAFTENIIQLLSDSAKRAAMGEAGLEQAKRFSWEKCAEATLKTYKTL
jgi:glycosyltransferase involved in cell wall biosynthesis